MLTKVQDRALRESWRRFDRATAFGCAQRGTTFDPAFCERMRLEHEAVMEQVNRELVEEKLQ